MTVRASLDIGSQTIRLLIARCDAHGSLMPLRRDCCIVRLGEGTHATRRLSPAAMDRAAACIMDFAAKARSFGAVSTHAVATACVRDAQNATVFLDRISATAGIRPVVLSGRDEALMMLSGVRSVLRTSLRPPALVMDIGGGSTEFISVAPAADILAESLPLGVIALAERHLLRDPPAQDAMAAMRDVICCMLASSAAASRCRHAALQPLLIGTAGTVTTLAAMDQELISYDPAAINGYSLSRSRIEALLHRMLALTLTQRSRLPGLEPGRADVIIPGAAIVLAVMDMLNLDTMLACDAGLLEGALLFDHAVQM